MLLLRGATILTMNDAFDIVEGDVLVDGSHIAAVGAVDAPPGTPVIDTQGDYLLPGFVQTHVHLCQTLFRGLADDLALLDWLRTRIWPLEAAHTPDTLVASAATAVAELIAGGTTTVLTMETVHDTDAVFETVAAMGLRAVIGKCLMDADEDVPARLTETTRRAIDESLALARRWHGGANGRLRAAFAPRFALSCTRELLEALATLATEEGLLVHTHASENRDEVRLVRERTGFGNVDYFTEVGLAAPHLCLAHCVWVDAREQELIAERDVKVLHCPGSNLKLGSGIAPVAELRARGACVSLGADGAACNNRLDMFQEMRLAATLQAARVGPGALPARDVLAMATREGARTLGLEREIGTVAPGKRADLVLVRRDAPHTAPDADPYATLVYAAGPADVRTVLVDGEVLVADGRPTRWDAAALAARARAAATALRRRAGV
ncbi:MAG: 5'-deoxyadenosine deaminase [Vicinamibacterales bacterium]